MSAGSFRLEKTLDELIPRATFANDATFDDHNGVLSYGAGPTNVSKRVHLAASTSIVGHLDPDFLKVMGLNQQAIRVLYGRAPNDSSYPMIVPGTGSDAASAAIYNMLNPGDLAAVVQQGYFGNRIVDFLNSHQIKPLIIDADWGKSVDPNRLEDRLKALKASGSDVKALLAVLVETSTGVRDPNIRAYSDIYRRIFPDGYVIVDAVSGTGGIPISIDDLGADVIFTGVQKGIGSKNGVSIALFDERAIDYIKKMKVRFVDWNKDLLVHQKYLNAESGPRPFVVSFPAHEGLALYQALQDLFDFPGGLEVLYKTQEMASELFAEKVGPNGMGFTNFVEDPALRAPTVHALRMPQGVDIPTYLKRLKDDYRTELNGGLGQLSGQIIRVGLLGPVNLQRRRVIQLTKNMEKITDKIIV